MTIYFVSSIVLIGVLILLVGDEFILYPRRLRHAKPIVLKLISRPGHWPRHVVEGRLRSHLAYESEASRIITDMEASGELVLQPVENKQTLVMPSE